MSRVRTITSGKFSLRYIVEGNGIPVLIIGDPSFYQRVFSKNFRNHFKLVFMSHRGFAPSPGKVDVSEFELPVLLNDIELIRKATGIDKAIVLGHSGHGYLALEYAKKYPQHTLGVAMIGLGPDQSDASHKASDEYFELLACDKRKEALGDSIKHIPEELEKNPEDRLIIYMIRLAARGWYDYTFDPAPLWKDVTVNMQMFDHVWGGIFKNIDITQGLEHFNKPVFLGLGKYDFIVAPPSSWEKFISLFKNITVELFDKSGHTPPYEEPELFDKKLIAWVHDTIISKND